MIKNNIPTDEQFDNKINQLDSCTIPERIAIITSQGYINAINFCNETGDNACLKLLSEDYVEDVINDNKCYVKHGDFGNIREISIRELLSDDYAEMLSDKDAKIIVKNNNQMIETTIQCIYNTDFENINLGLLSVLFSVILKDAESKNFENIDVDHPNNVVISISDLCERIGYRSGLSKQQIESTILRDLRAYRNIVGIYVKNNGNRNEKGYLGVININRSTEKILSFNSPYFSCIIKILREMSIQKTPRPDGRGGMKATCSYLIKTEIVKARNRIAVENVKIIVALIERAGRSGKPHISVKLLIERNTLLQYRLKHSKTKYWQQILKRAFSGAGGTFDLLRRMTLLQEKYIDINLHSIEEYPSTEDIRNNRTLEFEHKGINPDWGKGNV
ncbi:MAG: hypothetical protein LUH58_00825 [Lachnospiraceae bacterium]|nr:hypothetical protein [Lachnospiraceae bacterium]